jgi:hypothetical protein
MEDLLKQLSSLSWWIGVVVVGVIVSLVAAYLKPRIDSIIASVSDRSRKKNERREEQRQAQIAFLRGGRHEQLMFALGINHRRLRALSFILVGVLVMLTALALPEFIRLARLVAMAFAARPSRWALRISYRHRLNARFWTRQGRPQQQIPPYRLKTRLQTVGEF